MYAEHYSNSMRVFPSRRVYPENTFDCGAAAAIQAVHRATAQEKGLSYRLSGQTAAQPWA